MFWDKKETKSKLPDLPPLKAPALNLMDREEEIERHILPSFPDSPMRRGFSQSAIKDAVEVADNGSDSPEERKSFKTVEMEGNEVEDDEEKEEHEDERLAPPPEMHREAFYAEKMEKRSHDIFVKIDKFQSAKRALSATKEKLASIDDLLKRIREIKMREEQELAAWEKEFAAIKIKIKDVTENIFESVE